MTNGTERFFEAWKKQAEVSVRMMDAVVEATAKMRGTQLSAANETHERTQALEKALADAGNAQEMWGAQWNWALATCERSAAYWRSLFEAMAEANGRMARCVQDGMQCASKAQAGEANATGFAAVDGVYREMLKSSQRLLESATGVFQATALEPVAIADQPKKAA